MIFTNQNDCVKHTSLCIILIEYHQQVTDIMQFSFYIVRDNIKSGKNTL